MNKAFKRIVLIEETGMRKWGLEDLQEYAEEPLVIYREPPTTAEEAIQRIGNAEAVFVSWVTPLDETVLSACPNLRYIGMCCSLFDDASANVAVNYARSRGIVVTGIFHYGDLGVSEFITAELVRLLKGMGEWQWQSEPVELKGRKVGIIGLGTTGRMLADRLSAFGTQVFYYNRSRRPDAEAEGILYLPLDKLLASVEVISFHLPRGTKLLDERRFQIFGNGKILINTSLGPMFDLPAFERWIQQPTNFAIMDGEGMGLHRTTFEALPRVITNPMTSGWTRETRDRLSQKVLDNLYHFVVAQEA